MTAITNRCRNKKRNRLKKGAERKEFIMKKLLSIALVIVTVFSLMIPVFASAGVVYGQEMWVNCADGKTLNLRKEPSTVTGKLITRLECGTKVTVLDDLGNGWLKVTTGKNAGYVMAKFLVASKPGKYEITERSDNFITVQNPYFVTAKALNDKTIESVGLRVRPNKTSEAIRRLVAGDQLQVLAKGKVWSRVFDLKTGRTGYVANDYMQVI